MNQRSGFELDNGTSGVSANTSTEKVPLQEKVCTCASFFTVRGVHKTDCPLSENKNPPTETIERILEENLETIKKIPMQDNPPTDSWEADFHKVFTGPLYPELRSFIKKLLSIENEKAEQRGRDSAVDYIERNKGLPMAVSTLDRYDIILASVLESARATKDK